MFNVREHFTHAMRHSWREGDTPEQIVGYGLRVTIKKDGDTYKTRVVRDAKPDVWETAKLDSWEEFLAYLTGLRCASIALICKSVKL